MTSVCGLTHSLKLTKLHQVIDRSNVSSNNEVLGERYCFSH